MKISGLHIHIQEMEGERREGAGRDVRGMSPGQEEREHKERQMKRQKKKQVFGAVVKHHLVHPMSQ